MAKTLVYQGNPDGEMIFDFTTRIIHCAATIDLLQADALYVACLDMEDELLALSQPGIVDGQGKTLLGEVESAITVTLRGWKVRSSKSDGSRFTVGGGNVVTLDLNTGLTSPSIFIDNTEVVYVNNLATNSVIGNFTGDLEAILRSLSDTVFLDPVNGVSGQGVGVGLPAQPSSSLADALAIAQANSIRKLAVLGNVMVDQALPAKGVRSEGGNHTIVLTGSDINASSLSDSIVTGSSNGFTTLNFCTVGNVTGFLGQMRSCGLLMSIALAPNPINAPRFIDCFESDPTDSHPTIDLSAGTTTSCTFQRFAGSLTLSGMDNPLKRVELNMIGGQLTLDASCTAGTVLLTGSGATPINNGTATIVPLGFVTDAVSSGGSGGLTSGQAVQLQAAATQSAAAVAAIASLNDLSAAEVETATAAALTTIESNIGILLQEVAIARKGVTNRHLVDTATNTGTLFDDDGETPLYVFDLMDAVGSPASEQVYERTPRVQGGE
ncbi:MAG: hypothetical protein AAFO83_01750 [Cyanobacteria bacterium J06607_13]